MPKPYSTAEFEEKYTYDGNDLGATWSQDKTTFKVWAPTAEKVVVNLYASGDETKQDTLETVEMTLGENGVWSAEKEGDLNGTYYTYSVIINHEIMEAGDPYAKTTGVNGKRAMVINLDETDPEGWAKDKNPNAKMNITDAVIYETHLRDLSADESSGVKNKGKFLSLTETETKTSAGNPTGLDYLRDLGITHLHILPMYDFGSVDETKLDTEQYNWGYDPVNYNVPEGSYSTNPQNGSVRVKEAKEMVKSLHDNGISVIMDVVYNHVYDSQTFSYNILVPEYFSRINDYGEYANGSGCGNDNATERNMVKKYIVDSVNYWVEEYHIDGFRFDLVGLIDTETMNEVIETVHKKHPDVIFYGEGWSMDTSLTKTGHTLTTQDNIEQVSELALFNDYFRDNVRGANGNASDGGYVSGASGKSTAMENIVSGSPSWAQNPTQVINYNACHDNNTLFDKLSISNGLENFDDNVKRNKLSAAVMFTSQGTPFMMSGEEILRTKTKEDAMLDGKTKDEDSFDSNSYKSGDLVNSIKWDTLSEISYKNVYEYYRGLIAFRKAHGGLRMTSSKDVEKHLTMAEETPENVVAFSISGSYKAEKSKGIYVIYNSNKEVKEVTLPAGEWSVYVNGEKAGTEVIEKVKDKVTVEGISAMILVKEK
ncbi:MAG: type I pullulanase [Lachnospiraceae bacterium]|nr:type I pullulanase [Lachnospiraceae bacterium]